MTFQAFAMPETASDDEDTFAQLSGFVADILAWLDGRAKKDCAKLVAAVLQVL